MMAIDPIHSQQFAQIVLQWFDQFGRKNLPWQHPRTPYRVWIAEIMLQQTQVKTVIPYFERFMAKFPELNELATAPEEAVLAIWSGLGYYSRARNLHKTARLIMETYQGQWPACINLLSQLPGIGQSTAAAIASLAFNQRTAILDGNVKRVLSRYFMVEGQSAQKAIKEKLWHLAQSCMPHERCADYTQAIMDFGATVCTRNQARCAQCPLQSHCLAYQHHRVQELPHKKMKQAIPTRERQFLLIHNQAQQIYLEKNPPEGIWGSLWCLPNIPRDKNPLDHLTQLGFNHHHSIATPLMSFKHQFTHFRLNISALLLPLATVKPIPSTVTAGVWFTQQELLSLGMPKPVQTIINTFFDSNS